MEDETLQEALDFCLDNPEGLEMEELLEKFPESRDELVPLLALCGLIDEAVPAVPQERKDAMKGRILDAAMTRQQAVLATVNGHLEGALAATLPIVTVEPESPAQPVRISARVRVEESRPRRNFLADWLRRPVFAAAAFAALILAFVWALSASAMPDSPFYRVRMLGESIAVNVQTSPEAKLLKHDELANIRLREIGEMERQGKLSGAQRAFADYAEHLRKGQEILGGTQFTEQQQSRLARALYATSTTGEIKLEGLEDEVAGLPEPVRESLSESKQLQEQVRTYSADVLEHLGESPQTSLPPETQDILKQTPGPDATALAPSNSQDGTPATATSSPTSLGNAGGGSDDEATATRGVPGGGRPDKTATYIAGHSGASATPTSTSTQAATATATQTSVLAASATNTQTARATSTSTSTAQAEVSPLASTPTPTNKPKNGATVTPPRGKPTETRRPESTRTPGRPATITPHPEKTKKPGDFTATPTATYTYTYSPTSTPSHTPVPTSTFTATASPTEVGKDKHPTNTPKPKELPTDTAEPTEEPSEPSRPVSVCDVDVKDVSVGCGSGDCVVWSAQLRNKSTEAIEINWVAEMQVEVAGAAPMTYRDSGTVLVRPGEESISSKFCEALPDLTKKVSVTVRTDTGSASCDSSKHRSIDPCATGDNNAPKPTKEPEPTKVAEPTKEPRPTKTPQATVIVLPTIQLLPTKTPKSR